MEELKRVLGGAWKEVEVSEQLVEMTHLRRPWSSQWLAGSILQNGRQCPGKHARDGAPHGARVLRRPRVQPDLRYGVLRIVLTSLQNESKTLRVMWVLSGVWSKIGTGHRAMVDSI